MLSNVEEVILRAAEKLKPKGALIPFTDLYKALNYSRDALNTGLLSLEEKGLIYFSRDNRAHLLKPAERAKRLKVGEDYYIGFAVRNPMTKKSTTRKTRKRNTTVIKAKRVKIGVANRTRRRNVGMGFRDKSGRFHPIRASEDYKPWREGHTTRSAKKRAASRKAAATARSHAATRSRRATTSRLASRSLSRSYALPAGSRKRRNPISGWVIQFVRDAVKEGRTLEQMQEVMQRSGFSAKEIQEASKQWKIESGLTPAQKEKRVDRLYGKVTKRNPLSGDRARLKSVLTLLRKLKSRALRASGIERSLLRRQIIELQGERFTLEQRVKGFARSRNPGVTKKSRTTRKMFTGMKSRRTISPLAPRGTPRSVAILGKLVKIKTRSRTFTPPKRTGRNPEPDIYLAADDAGNLHIVGDPLPILPGPARDLGEIIKLDYATKKPHLGYGQTTEFFHDLGEEGGQRPHLMTDSEGHLKIVGGDYYLQSDGIHD